MIVDVEKHQPIAKTVLGWEHIPQAPGSVAGHGASAAGNYWAEVLRANDLLLLIAGIIALLIICTYLIARRDRAHGKAYKNLNIVPFSELEFFAQHKPNTFKALAAHHSPSLNRFFAGVQLDRRLVIFDQASLAVNSAGHTARRQSTFAIINLQVDIPDFEVDNVASVKNNTVLFNPSNRLKLSASLCMDPFIVQGRHHEQLRKVFNADLCAILVEHPYLYIDCKNSQLLISRQGIRVYTAKGAHQFIQLITDVVRAMESNRALTTTHMPAKAA